jgi:hypothetical protein
MDASSKKRKAPGTSAKPKASSKAATGSVKALAKDDDGDWTDSEQERKLETRRPTVATSLKKLKASRSSAKHNVIPKVAINKIQATVVGGDVTRDLVDTETAPGGRINEIFKAAVAKLGSHANANPGSYIGLTQLAQDFFVFGCQKVPANHQPGLSELIKEAIPKYLGYSNDKTAQRGYVEKSVFEVLKTKPHTFYYRFPNKQYLELPDELVKLKLRVLLATTCSLLPADQRNALKPAAMLTAKSIAKAGVKGFNEYVAAAPQIPSNKVNFDKCYVFTPNHACGIEEDAAGPLRQYISNHAVECHEAVDGNAFLDQALLNLKKDGERTRFYYSLFTDKLAKNRYYVELPNEHVKTKLAARFDSFICHNRIASSKSHKSSAQEASPNQTATEVAAEAVAAKPKSRKHPRCRIEGCFKQARPGKTGLCLRHGANSILCTVPDCTSQAGDNSGGMCGTVVFCRFIWMPCVALFY